MLLGLLDGLVQENRQQTERIEQLRNEIAMLKGEKAKPTFKPSAMDKKAGTDSEQNSNDDEDDSLKGDSWTKKKWPGSKKRAQKQHLPIHDTRILAPHSKAAQSSLSQRLR